jgi:hypothetical protein
MTTAMRQTISNDSSATITAAASTEKFSIRLEDRLDNETHTVTIFHAEEARRLAAALLLWADNADA